MTKKQRYEEFAKRFSEDGGKVTLAECGICGHLEWVSTYKSEPQEVVVTPLTYSCPICSEAFYRSPEIVSWVMAVVFKTQEDIAELKEHHERK